MLPYLECMYRQARVLLQHNMEYKKRIHSQYLIYYIYLSCHKVVMIQLHNKDLILKKVSNYKS